jgi:hypothetical protein
MGRLLELPEPLYAALEKAAEVSGTTPQGWIAAHLPDVTSQEPAGAPKTLADLFAGRVGRVRSGGKEVLSENCGPKFTEYLERKRQEGHL